VDTASFGNSRFFLGFVINLLGCTSGQGFGDVGPVEQKLLRAEPYVMTPEFFEKPWG